MDSLPLQDLKILDLSSVLAGPLTGSFFAEMGADVLKIENQLTGGDVTRQWKLPAEDVSDPYSAYYASANYGKDIKLMDLTQADERQTLEKYIAEADVIISNFQKRTAQKLNLDPHEIVKRYPELIFIQLSAYTWDDPRPGYDFVMQGETGWISMTGTDHNHLTKLPVALMDIIASHQMRTAGLLALIQKNKTGKGSIVHVSLYKSAISALANQASNYLMTGMVPQPLGTLHPNIAPYGDIFVTKDEQKVMLAIGSDNQFKKLWFTLNLDKEMYSIFVSNSDRVYHRMRLATILQREIEKLKYDELSKMLEHEQLPFCLIHDLKDVFDSKLANEMVHTETKDTSTFKSVSSVAFSIV